MSKKKDFKLPSLRKAKFRRSHPYLSRWSMEKTHAVIGRLVAEKNFKTIDEANEFLKKEIVGGQVPDLPPRTPTEEAQYLIYDACDEPSKKKRIAMARRALEISKDCADAYVFLAEEEATAQEEEKALYEEGLRAAERFLGPEKLREHSGHFWSVLETRPYMRARLGLAGSLWYLGSKEEALGHYREMLRLNPNDNQGARYPLLNHLLELGRDREARELIDRYDGDMSAYWLYGKALLKFKREGSNPKSDARLRKAFEYNLFVPIFLFGAGKIPKRIPSTVGIGDESEAIEYVASAMRVWYETPGAMEWMMDVMMRYEPRLALPRVAKGKGKPS